MNSIPFSTRVQYEMIWAARMLYQNDHLFKKKEKRLERRIISKNDLSEAEARIVPLDEVHIRDFDPETFAKKYVCKRPLVIREAFKHSVPVQKWDLNFLKSQFPDVLVPVHERAEKGSSLYDKGIVECPLGEFIEDVQARKGSKYMVGSSTLLGHGDRQLVKDIPLQEITELFSIHILRPELFIGNENNWSPWHSAGPETFFIQVHGQKEWKFVDPKYTSLMYPAYGYINGPAAVQTQIELQNLDAYPLYNLPQIYTVTLEPGDLLYNAPHWWHEVTNIGETIGMPLRVAPRKMRHNPFLFINKVQMLNAMRSKTWRKILRDMAVNKFQKKSLSEIDMNDDPVKMSYKNK